MQRNMNDTLPLIERLPFISDDKITENEVLKEAEKNIDLLKINHTHTNAIKKNREQMLRLITINVEAVNHDLSGIAQDDELVKGILNRLCDRRKSFRRKTQATMTNLLIKSNDLIKKEKSLIEKLITYQEYGNLLLHCDPSLQTDKKMLRLAFKNNMTESSFLTLMDKHKSLTGNIDIIKMAYNHFKMLNRECNVAPGTSILNKADTGIKRIIRCENFYHDMLALSYYLSFPATIAATSISAIAFFTFAAAPSALLPFIMSSLPILATFAAPVALCLVMALGCGIALARSRASYNKNKTPTSDPVKGTLIVSGERLNNKDDQRSLAHNIT